MKLSVKERVRMVLAEAGYPNADVRGADNDPGVSILPTKNGVPDKVCWKAFRVALREDRPCWPCYDMGYGDACYEGDCRSGGVEK